eukprot:1148812-Pelagomonas_calceolata.AAC.18
MMLSLSYHLTNDRALETREDVESTIHMVTFWEVAHKASGSYEADCILGMGEEGSGVLGLASS